MTIVVGSNKLIIMAKPLRLDFYQNDVLTVSANSKGLMRFERLRLSTDAVGTEAEVKFESVTEFSPYALIIFVQRTLTQVLGRKHLMDLWITNQMAQKQSLLTLDSQRQKFFLVNPIVTSHRK